MGESVGVGAVVVEVVDGQYKKKSTFAFGAAAAAAVASTTSSGGGRLTLQELLRH